MKKLISLLLAVMMSFGCVTVGLADNSAEGLTVNNWNGWTVLDGSAVTTSADPGDGTRGDIVKIDGEVTLAPSSAPVANVPVVQLSVDVYGTGTVSLVDVYGDAAATLDLSEDTPGYVADAWNTVELLAVSGKNTYKAYVNGTEAEGNGDTGYTIIPENVYFCGIDMYVDNIVLQELSKDSSYTEIGTVDFYTADFSAPSRNTGDIDGTDGWAVQALNANHIIKYTIGTDTFASDSTKKNVIKMEKTSDEKPGYWNPLWRTASYPASAVFSMDIYAEEVMGGELQINLRDQSGYQVGLLSLYHGTLLLFNNGTVTEVANAYEAEEWHNLRVETNQETQSADFYWDNEKLNSTPYKIGSAASDSFTKFTEFSFNLNDSLPACTFYVANFEVDSPMAGEVLTTVFEEDFDDEESQFSYVDLDANATDCTTLTSGYDQTIIASGQTMRNGVARFNRSRFSSGDAYHVLESDNSQDDPEGTCDNTVKQEIFSTPELNLEGAKDIRVTFDVYSPDIARKYDETGVYRDVLLVGLSSQQNFTEENETHIQIGADHHCLYYGDGFNERWDMDGTYHNKWSTVEYKMGDAGRFTGGSETVGVLVDGIKGVWLSNEVTEEDLSSLKYLTMSIPAGRGGRFYFDNFKIQATKNMGEVVDSYYTAAEYYSDDVTRNSVSDIGAVSVVFAEDGSVESVALHKNNSYTVAEGTKMFVAVYSGSSMTDCGVVEIDGADFVDGEAVYELSGVEAAEGSVVMVYVFNNLLVPQATSPYSIEQ